VERAFADDKFQMKHAIYDSSTIVARNVP